MTKGEMNIIRELIESISRLTCEVCAYRLERQTEFEWCRSHHGLATKDDLKEMEKRILMTFKQWAEANAPKLTNIQQGLKRAIELILKMQNSPGEFTPEDQVTADQLEATLNSIGADADSVPTPPVA